MACRARLLCVCACRAYPQSRTRIVPLSTSCTLRLGSVRRWLSTGRNSRRNAQRKQKDHYSVLGISRSATQSEIKEAYRTAAKKTHPDLNTKVERKLAETQFAEVNNAYETLSDPEKRSQYDQYGEEYDNDDEFHSRGARTAEEYGGGSFGGGFEFEDFSSDMFEEFDAEEIFYRMSGRKRSQKRTMDSRVSKRGADITTTIRVDFMEAVVGCSRSLHVSHLTYCESCKGTGNMINSKKTRSCNHCHGHRTVTVQMGYAVMEIPCPACGGSGRTYPLCRSCSGSGVNRIERDIEVKVPAGVDTGTTLRVSNMGDAGQYQGPRGHLLVKVLVSPHSTLVRKGNDVHVTVELPLRTAILGGDVQVPGLRGMLTVPVRPGTQPNDVQVLKGIGFSSLQYKNKGDQHVIFNVRIPRKVDEKARETLQQFLLEIGELKSEAVTLTGNGDQTQNQSMDVNGEKREKRSESNVSGKRRMKDASATLAKKSMNNFTGTVGDAIKFASKAAKKAAS